MHIIQQGIFYPNQSELEAGYGIQIARGAYLLGERLASSFWGATTLQHGEERFFVSEASLHNYIWGVVKEDEAVWKMVKTFFRNRAELETPLGTEDQQVQTFLRHLLSEKSAEERYELISSLGLVTDEVLKHIEKPDAVDLSTADSNIQALHKSWADLTPNHRRCLSTWYELNYPTGPKLSPFQKYALWLSSSSQAEAMEYEQISDRFHVEVKLLHVYLRSLKGHLQGYGAAEQFRFDLYYARKQPEPITGTLLQRLDRFRRDHRDMNLSNLKAAFDHEVIVQCRDQGEELWSLAAKLEFKNREAATLGIKDPTVTYSGSLASKARDYFTRLGILDYRRQEMGLGLSDAEIIRGWLLQIGKDALDQLKADACQQVISAPNRSWADMTSEQEAIDTDKKLLEILLQRFVQNHGISEQELKLSNVMARIPLALNGDLGVAILEQAEEDDLSSREYIQQWMASHDDITDPRAITAALITEEAIADRLEAMALRRQVQELKDRTKALGKLADTASAMFEASMATPREYQKSILTQISRLLDHIERVGGDENADAVAGIRESLEQFEIYERNRFQKVFRNQLHHACPLPNKRSTYLLLTVHELKPRHVGIMKYLLRKLGINADDAKALDLKALTYIQRSLWKSFSPDLFTTYKLPDPVMPTGISMQQRECILRSLSVASHTLQSIWHMANSYDRKCEDLVLSGMQIAEAEGIRMPSDLAAELIHDMGNLSLPDDHPEAAVLGKALANLSLLKTAADRLLPLPTVETALMHSGYRRKYQLAKGGFGEVVVYEKDGKDYAVKILNQQMDDPEQVMTWEKMFAHRRGEVLRAKSPYLVVPERFIPARTVDGQVETAIMAMVMPLVKGVELFTVAENAANEGKRPLNGEALRKALRQILQALAALHKEQIAHKDVKLENVIIDTDSFDCVLLDLGLAEKVDQGSTRFSGSPMYCAPEIGTQRIHGVEVDMWSMGIMAFVMANGYFPLDIDPCDYKALVSIHEMIVRRPRKWLLDLRKMLSKSGIVPRSPLGTLVQGMLDPDPTKRITVEEALKHPYFNAEQAQVLPALSSRAASSTD